GDGGLTVQWRNLVDHILVQSIVAQVVLLLRGQFKHLSGSTHAVQDLLIGKASTLHRHYFVHHQQYRFALIDPYWPQSGNHLQHRELRPEVHPKPDDVLHRWRPRQPHHQHLLSRPPEHRANLVSFHNLCWRGQQRLIRSNQST